MAASWGGHSFIINIIPVYTMYLFLADRLDNKAYIAYTTFYTVGTLLAF